MQFKHLRKKWGNIVLAIATASVTTKIQLPPALPKLRFRSAHRLLMAFAKSQADLNRNVLQQKQFPRRLLSRPMQTSLFSHELLVLTNSLSGKTS
jgi:hypothetical protein